MERLDCERMFVAVLDTGSFARAARRLGTSGGQASKLVSRLESDLGVQLIKRTTRALPPTEVGQAYYERIKALLDERDALEAAVRSMSGTPSGRLKLSAPLSFGTLQLAPALLDFACEYPAIRLDVSFSDRLVNLVDEGFDAAVRVGFLSDSAFIASKLCDVRLVVAASPSYLAANGTPRHPTDLHGHACIMDANHRDPDHWRFIAPGVGGSIDVPVSGLRFSNGEACAAAAERGLGVACVPSFIAGPRILKSHLRPLLTEYEDAPIGVYCLYPPARHLALKVRAVVDFLALRFQGGPEWERGW